MPRKARVLLTAAALSFLLKPAFADVLVRDAWSRATTSSAKIGVGYLVLNNSGAEDDTLLAVSSPIAKEVQIHTMNMDNGIMQMRQIDGLPIKAGESVALAPGGLHLMLMGLERGLVENQSFSITLSFASGAVVTVPVTVKNATAQQQDAQQSGHH